MTSREKLRYTLWMAVFAAGVVLVFMLNVGVGSADITVGDIMRIIFGKVDPSDVASLIIRKLRLPRAAAGIGCGAALAIAGYLLQTYFANPIVEPYILGISSGSSLFVGLVLLGGFTFGVETITPMFIVVGAFVGALIITAIVLVAATRVKNIITILIVGLMAGYLCGAVTSMLSAFTEHERLARYTVWAMGSYSGFTGEQLTLMFAIVIPMLVCAVLLAKPLNALTLGDNYARSMGINVKLTRYAIIVISSVLTAAVTAFAGPVSFIGLAVPHICRIVFRTTDSRLLIPGAILGGAFLSSLCDLIARNIMSPVDLPLGAITAIIGAPIVVFLLTRKEKIL